MKRFLLAGVGLLALSGPAAAQGFPVIDIAANLKMARQVIHDLKDEIAQDAQLAELIGIYRTSQAAYYEANAITNIDSWQGALGYAQTRFPLPTEIGDVAALFQGVGSGGSIMPQVVGFLERNVAYAPRAPDFQAWRINTNAQTTAGQMAIAQQSYDAATRRLEGADEMQGRMASARTVAEKHDLTARAGIEGVRAQAQGNYLLASLLWQNARRDADEQVQEQSRRQSVDRMIEDADAVIAGGGRRGSGGPGARPPVMLASAPR